MFLIQLSRVLANKSDITSWVGQYSTLASLDATQSLMKKNCMLMCPFHLLLDQWPYLSRIIALWLSWYTTDYFNFHLWYLRKINSAFIKFLYYYSVCTTNRTLPLLRVKNPSSMTSHTTIYSKGFTNLPFHCVKVAKFWVKAVAPGILGCSSSPGSTFSSLGFTQVYSKSIYLFTSSLVLLHSNISPIKIWLNVLALYVSSSLVY